MDFTKEDGKTKLLSAIVKEMPWFATQPFHVPAKGTRSHVFVFEQAVFKGPREEAQVPYIEQEYKILRHLEGRNLPVPKVTCVGKNAVFFGMTRLPGEALTRDIFETMSIQDRDFLAIGLANFMAGLAAAFTKAEAKELIQFTGEYSLKAEIPESALDNPAVLDVLRDNLHGVENAVMEYRQMLLSKTPIVIHDDFHMSNIIMSPDGRMSGVIDFGYMNIGLPEEGLFSWGRAFPDFTSDICLRYSQLTGKAVSYRHYLLCNLSSKITSIANACHTGNLQDIADAKTRINEILSLLRITT